MSTIKITKENVIGAEARHVIYIPPAGDDPSDYHYVKEILHVKDGDRVIRVPNVRKIKDFKRTFYVTKPAFRNHKDKKEWEKLDHCKQFESTESRLLINASRALGEFRTPRNMKQLHRNPYLYDTDISSTSMVKQERYRNKFPELNTPSSMAACDTETNMLDGSDSIIMGTVSYKERVFTAVVKSFFNGIDDPEAKLQHLLIKLLGDVVKKRNITWEIKLVDNQAQVAWEMLQKTHEWQPDFLTFWNMDFDVKKINDALYEGRIPLERAWSDPELPPQYQFFEYKEGSRQKVTASGKVTPIPPHQRWHSVFTPASFYVIDAMCAYKQIRTGKQEERSYKLDFILNKHLKRGKLKFEAADHLSHGEWHKFMQKNYPLEYTIYNVFDCIGLEMLDEKTNDIAVSLPSGAAMSDYSKFNSQPRRLCDKLHYFVRRNNLVMGTTSDRMETPDDAKVTSLGQWIVMLPAHNVANNGLCLIEEYPDLRTNIRLAQGD